jgi:serine/threonine protein kinase
VIHIFDFVSDSTKTFVTMEYFDAPNMKQWIYQGFDSIAHLLPQVIQQASEGMAYLHKQGYVHRDIKPDNFLIDESGEVKLIDFALCVRKKGLVGRLLGGRGKVQGTRSYMSPEQIRGQALDERADIYSFGCTLYELLTGRPPFTGVSTNDLLTKHLRTPPPSLEAGNRNVTSQFGQLVRRMLSKDPSARPQSMDDVIRELKSVPILKSVPAPPA